MRFPLWIAGSLTLLPLSAQSTVGLATGNVVLQQDEAYVEFDVTNHSSRPAHAWTMSLTAKRNTNPSQVEFLLTSEACSRDASGPLAPNQTRHCAVSLHSASPVPILEATPRVTAVLYEDGTTEGDLAALERQSADRGIRLRARQYWLDRLREICATPSLQSLKNFADILRDPGPAIPAGLAADPNFTREQRWLQQQASNALQQIQLHDLDPAAAVRGLTEDVERRVNLAREAAALFPEKPINP